MMEMKSGALTGAAAATNLELGFLPSAFLLINTTKKKVYLYEKSMTAAYYFSIETTTGDNTYGTSGGFTAYTGSEPTVSLGTTGGKTQGLTIGTTILSQNDVCFYMAFK